MRDFLELSKAYYFDSLGKDPGSYSRNLRKLIEENCYEWTFIPKQVQSNSSDICGLYVVFFALMKICFHLSIHDIYHLLFFSENAYVNDDFVKSYFNNLQ